MYGRVFNVFEDSSNEKFEEKELPNSTGYTGSDKLKIIINHIESLEATDDFPTIYEYLHKISWRCNEITGADKFSLRSWLNERDWDLLDFLCQVIVDPKLTNMLSEHIEILKTEFGELIPYLNKMAEQLQSKETTEKAKKKKSGKEHVNSRLPHLNALIGCWLDIRYIDAILQYLAVLREQPLFSNRFFRIAILRIIEIIGEYAKKFSGDTASVLPEDDWKKLKELRNQIEHLRRGTWLTQEVDKLLEVDNPLLNAFYERDLNIIYQQLEVVKKGLEVLAEQKLNQSSEEAKLVKFLPDGFPGNEELINTAEILSQVFNKGDKLSPADQWALLAKTFTPNQAKLYQAIFPKRMDIDFRVLENVESIDYVKLEWQNTTNKQCLLLYCQENDTWSFAGWNRVEENIIDDLPEKLKDVLPKIKKKYQLIPDEAGKHHSAEEILKRFENMKKNILISVSQILGYSLNESDLFNLLGLNNEAYDEIIDYKNKLKAIKGAFALLNKDDTEGKKKLTDTIKLYEEKLKPWKNWFDLLRHRNRYLQRSLTEEEYAQKVSGLMQGRLSKQQLKLKQILNHELPTNLGEFDLLVAELVSDHAVANEIICEVGDKLDLNDREAGLFSSDTGRREKTEIYHVIKEVKVWYKDVMALGNLAEYYLKQNNNDPAKLQTLFSPSSFYYLAAQKLLEVVNETSERLMDRQVYNQYFSHAENISPPRLLLFKRFRGGIAHRPMAIDSMEVAWFFYHWVIDAHSDIYTVHQNVQSITAASIFKVNDNTPDLDENPARLQLTPSYFMKNLGAILAYCMSTPENVHLVGGLLNCDIGIQANLNFVLIDDNQSITPFELLDIQWRLAQLLGMTVSIKIFSNSNNLSTASLLTELHLKELFDNKISLHEFSFRLEVMQAFRNKQVLEITLTDGTKVREGHKDFVLENAIQSPCVVLLEESNKKYRQIRNICINGLKRELPSYQADIKEKAKKIAEALIKRISNLNKSKSVKLCQLFWIEKELDSLIDSYFIEHKFELTRLSINSQPSMNNYRQMVKASQFETIKDIALINVLKELIRKKENLFIELAKTYELSSYNCGYEHVQYAFGKDLKSFIFLDSIENIQWLVRASVEFATLRHKILSFLYEDQDLLVDIFSLPIFMHHDISFFTVTPIKHQQRKFIMAIQDYARIKLVADEILSPKVFVLLQETPLDHVLIASEVQLDLERRFLEPEEDILEFENTEKKSLPINIHYI